MSKARPGHQLGTLHRPHGFIRLRQVAGDSRPRGSRLLLRRQPAGVAAAGDGGARRAPDRTQSRRRGDGHPRAALRAAISRAPIASSRPTSTSSSKLIFLEAGHAELVRRFSETRRPHPLAPDRPVTEGLAEERASLRPIRAMADRVIDTSKLNVHELRQQLRELVSGRKQTSKLVLTILSFGFQNGPPAEADLMFDVRFLKNPHWVPTLRAADRQGSGGGRLHPPAADGANGDEEAVVAAALDGPALRAGREELPDDRDRLHRRPPSIGLRRRSAEARAVGSQGRLGEGRASRPGETR